MTLLERYCSDYEDSPYGEAFNAWTVDQEILIAWDSEALDEYAQIALGHARNPYRSLIAEDLRRFAEKCHDIRMERAN